MRHARARESDEVRGQAAASDAAFAATGFHARQALALLAGYRARCEPPRAAEPEQNGNCLQLCRRR